MGRTYSFNVQVGMAVHDADLDNWLGTGLSESRRLWDDRTSTTPPEPMVSTR